VLIPVLVVAAAAAVAVAASWFMWWACRRSPIWSMAAGALLSFIALGGAIAIAWLL
jgi:hypothetical protein